MKATSLLTLLPLIALLAGCSGSQSLPEASGSTVSFGPITTRIIGAAQAPVISSAALGANVTALAGATVDQMTLNFYGTPTLRETKIAFASNRDGNYDIYTMNPDGAGLTNLTNNLAVDTSPAWSPDGTRIAFASNRAGNLDIYVMNANGTGLVQLTAHAAVDTHPVWSPNGTRIAFESNRDGNTEIYVMNSDGSGAINLTNNVASDISPSWSPDGTKLAFSSNRLGGFVIFSMNADGSDVLRRTDGSDIASNPAWSPDGRKIALDLAHPSIVGMSILAILDNQTLELSLVSETISGVSPAWSPDGQRLTFSSNQGGQFDIFSIEPSGHNPINLSRIPGATELAPSWSWYLPRTPKTLIGTGGALAKSAAGFLLGQRDQKVTSLVAFDTPTVASRSGARVTAQSAPFNDQGTNLIFSITTSAGLSQLYFVNGGYNDIPGQVKIPELPTGTTGALVSFSASEGTVTTVIPYSANRSAGLSPVCQSGKAIYTGHFGAIFDGAGKNIAPQGAKSVTLDEKTGVLVHFE